MGFDATREYIPFYFCFFPVRVVHAWFVGIKKSSVGFDRRLSVCQSVCLLSTCGISRNAATFV